MTTTDDDGATIGFRYSFVDSTLFTEFRALPVHTERLEDVRDVLAQLAHDDSRLVSRAVGGYFAGTITCYSDERTPVVDVDNGPTIKLP